jgi:hypothetical protein
MRWVALPCLLVACAGSGDRDPAGLVHTDHPKPDGGDGGGLMVDGGEGACGEFCGETFLHEIKDPKNLYFVLDRSGSMVAPMPDSTRTRYQTARAVLASLLRVIGHRVRYGAAVFPTTANPDDCSPGGEIFPVTAGGLPPCEGGDDPVLDGFLTRLGRMTPNGATPTAATLRAIRPALGQLEGETTVVLVTDGAPNCNLEASCEADGCTLNIEGATVNGRACDGGFNCCDPALTGEGMGGYCVDSDDTEAAVTELAEDGIRTYVVGMPGAEAYSTLLGRLAVAGGTAREDADVPYYATADSDALHEALYAIGTSIAIGCSITLDEAPSNPDMVNVYFDGEVLPSDPDAGWSWDGAATIRVNGEACERLKSGSVLDARAVFGCDTVVR